MTSAANGNQITLLPPVSALVNGRLLRITTIGDLSGCTIEVIRRYQDHQSAIINTSLANISTSLNGGAQ